MKRISGTQSVGIGATVDNALTGKLFEFSPDTAVVTFLALAASGDVRASILIGTDTVADDAQLQVGSVLVIPDSVIAQHGANRGERVTLRLRQVAGAGAVDVRWAVLFEPIG